MSWHQIMVHTKYCLVGDIRKTVWFQHGVSHRESITDEPVQTNMNRLPIIHLTNHATYGFDDSSNLTIAGSKHNVEISLLQIYFKIIHWSLNKRNSLRSSHKSKRYKGRHRTYFLRYNWPWKQNCLLLGRPLVGANMEQEWDLSDRYVIFD
jgi:hypothetical protein